MKEGVMDEIVRAAEYARVAHEEVGQLRKYTNEPYIKHPEEVARLVARCGGTEDMVCAAWLHDVVEGTKRGLEEVREEFGEWVAELVGWLTDVSKKEDGNRAVRKKLDREHIAQAPKEAKTIKLADLISNTKSIVEIDPKFAEVYLVEKELLLGVLREGDVWLWDFAHKKLEEGKLKLRGG